MTDRIADLRREANDQDAQAKSLIAQFGTGIRPAWVGEEIAIYRHRAAQARAEADQLEAQAAP